ncbi:hypothetical protein [Mycoplasmopsis bovirhinis]|uniref:Chromosome segregation protein SMC n=1 Tax=Mycoplasmopsis bovirhinis TaxID=29553 RepID=A0A449ACV7_9BACT|nr:hypothetical protein [Mycoplasmopsis bovirhinis]VEU62855.1 chromosome segregation protein SMC [Mycoplasmopsis bovirhinis]
MTIKLKNTLKLLLVVGTLGAAAGSIPLVINFVKKTPVEEQKPRTINWSISISTLSNELKGLIQEVKTSQESYQNQIDKYNQSIEENNAKIVQAKTKLNETTQKNQLLSNHDLNIEVINNHFNSLIELVNNDIFKQNLVKYIHDIDPSLKESSEFYKKIKPTKENSLYIIKDIITKNNELKKLIDNNQNFFSNSKHNLETSEKLDTLADQFLKRINSINEGQLTISATRDFLLMYERFLKTIKNNQYIKEFSPEILTLETNIAEKEIDNSQNKTKLASGAISLLNVLALYNNEITNYINENIAKLNTLIIDNVQESQITSIYLETIQSLSIYQKQFNSDYKNILNTLKTTFASNQELIAKLDEYHEDFNNLTKELDKNLRSGTTEEQLRISANNINITSQKITSSFASLLELFSNKLANEYQKLTENYQLLKEDNLQYQNKVAQIEALKQKMKLTQDEIEVLENEIIKIRNSKEIVPEIAELNIQIANQDINKKTKEIKEFKEQIINTQEEANNLENNIKQKTLEINTIINQNNILFINSSYFQNILKRNLSQIQSLTNEIKILTLRNNYNENKNKELEILLDKRQKHSDLLTTQVSELNDEILTKQEDIKILKEEIVVLNKQNEEQNNENLDLQREINRKNTKILELENEVLLLKNQINELNIVIAQKEDLIDQLTIENQNLNNELIKEKNQKEETQRQNNLLQNQKDNLANQNNALQGELNNQNALINQLRQENADLNRQISQQNQIINNLNKQNQNNNNRINELVKELDQEIIKNNQLVAENLNHTNALKQANNLIKTLESQVTNLKQTITSLEATNASLRNKVTNALGKLENILKQLNNYKATFTLQPTSQTITNYTRYENRIAYEISYNSLNTLRTTIINLLNEVLNILR